MASIDYAEYSRKMRQRLSLDEMITSDGSINHPYFLCKKNHYWGRKQHDALLKAIEKYGIGEYAKYKKEHHLKDFTVTEFELRICLLLNTKKLDEYKGRSVTEEEIAGIKEKNRGNVLY